MAKSGDVRVGVSGWVYPPWRGVFYPAKLGQKNELKFIGETFRTNEINGTFYGTQSPDSFNRWHDTVPDDFQFSVKAPRFITHILRLKNAQQPLANFLASGPLALGSKLGPILWQLPPSLKFDKDTIAAFLALLPQDTQAAVKLARKHDDRLKKAWTKTDEPRRLRHAMEIRHDSFRSESFIELLRAHNVALVCADTEKWPHLMDLTADFVYCRLHGSGELYFSNYTTRALNTWARRVADWAQGKDPPGDHVMNDKLHTRKKRDVFVYFDNTAKVHAPANALRLEKRVKQYIGKSTD